MTVVKGEGEREEKKSVVAVSINERLDVGRRNDPGGGQDPGIKSIDAEAGTCRKKLISHWNLPGRG